MERLTYKQAYDKIIEAYMKDEIKIFNVQFCFCGTLSPDKHWQSVVHNYNNVLYPYSVGEYGRMERALFSSFRDDVVYYGICSLNPGFCFTEEDLMYPSIRIKNYEDKLFDGMCAALDVLKEIHRERGENVDDVVVLKKRQLQLN